MSRQCWLELGYSCPADKVPNWQPPFLLGMVEARSVNVNKRTHTHTKWQSGNDTVHGIRSVVDDFVFETVRALEMYVHIRVLLAKKSFPCFFVLVQTLKLIYVMHINSYNNFKR